MGNGRTKWALIVASLSPIALTCTPANPPDPSGNDGPSITAVELGPLPDEVADPCQRTPELREGCPTRVPSFDAGAKIRTNTFRQGRHWTFTAEGGSGPYTDPVKNRPPGFFHVVVQGGDLSDAFETFTYATSKIFPVRDALMRSAERRRLAALGRSGETPMGLFLGERSWSGRRGVLILAPSFNYADSIHADHLIFFWRSDGSEHALSLHAWEPFSECVATLQAVVNSIDER